MARARGHTSEAEEDDEEDEIKHEVDASEMGHDEEDGEDDPAAALLKGLGRLPEEESEDEEDESDNDDDDEQVPQYPRGRPVNTDDHRPVLERCAALLQENASGESIR